MSDTLPLSIQNNRRMEKWLRFEPGRTVRLAVGKVEAVRLGCGKNMAVEPSRALLLIAQHLVRAAI